jgi:hypothetical protein
MEFYGDLTFADEASPGTVVTAKDPEMRALHVNYKWSSPFDQFFQHGGGADLRADYDRMLQLAEDTQTTESALELRLNPYLSQEAAPNGKACDFGILNWPSSEFCFGPPF